MEELRGAPLSKAESKIFLKVCQDIACIIFPFDFHLSFSKKRFPWADKWLFFKTSKTTFFFHSLPRKLLVKNKALMMQMKRYLA